MRKALLPLFIAVTALLAACRHAPPNLSSPGHTIVVLGDSLAAGVGSGPEIQPILDARRKAR